MSKKATEEVRTGKEIAVIGMAGRFPGARNINEFWENLKNSVESISFFSNKELEENGVDPELINHPDYAKAKGVLGDKEYFDSAFFGYTLLEAEIMNPQIRMFHECAWEALEDAGYDPEGYDGLIGFYAGASSSAYWEALSYMSGKSEQLGRFAASQLNDKDYISPRISYNLNLKGPVFSVQTACSTSLLAIHLACRGLLTGECKMALAGGIALKISPNQGYLFQEGMILSPDGHCRTFDAKAKGTIGGEGAGIVLLKRLSNAVNDNNHIYAVIKGTAINNDGKRKVGFTAPSVEAQAEVIQTALRLARVDPETISYIETHGTGTTLGDPVEIAALTLAFETDKRRFCAIGSVKTNLGHLDAAAGIAGLIKTILALKHRQIPPSLHYEGPNPEINFEDSAFYVNTGLNEWKNETYPLRAGVSSFGIGGTNVHAILEEAPPMEPSLGSKNCQMIMLSARTGAALDRATRNLARYFEENQRINFADAAYTLQVGRRVFKHRKVAICSTPDEAIHRLTNRSQNLYQFVSPGDNQQVVFMFPGQGSQYVNMGLDLYNSEPVFREQIDHCFRLLRPILGYDIKEILYPEDSVSEVSNDDYVRPAGKGDSPLERGTPDPRKRGEVFNINQTEVSQPLIFSVEYALARLLMKWGIKPYAMIGHSIGEYTAACLAGVFSLEDALALVARRGQLMQEIPPGAMLSVSAAEEDLKPLLNEHVSISAINSPSHCVLSGTHPTIEAVEKQLKSKNYQTRRLQTSHAFHSAMMEPVLEKFAQGIKKITLNPPHLPYISNVTGDWIKSKDLENLQYWVTHIRETVRFSKGLQKLLQDESSIFVEVGGGKALATFVRQHKNKKSDQLIINLLRHPRESVPDDEYLLNKVGQLWLYGIDIDWDEFYADEKRYRIPLPTYPFEKQRFGNDGNLLKIEAEPLGKKHLLNKKNDLEDFFHIPLWKSSPALPEPQPTKGENGKHRLLLFTNEEDLSSRLLKKLEEEKYQIITIKEGAEFLNLSPREFKINIRRADDYHLLLNELDTHGGFPPIIIHLWSIAGCNSDPLNIDTFNRMKYLGFYSLVYLAQAIRRKNIFTQLDITVVSSNLQEITGEELLCPGKSCVLGPVKVIPQEYPNIRFRSLDVDIPPRGSREEDQLATQLIKEISTPSRDTVIAYRKNRRWIQIFEGMKIAKSKEPHPLLKPAGIYLITGGLGGIGLILAETLVRTVGARLLLTGRSGLPPKEDWQHWLSTHPGSDKISQKIRKIRKLEEMGGQVMIFAADAADYERMRTVIAEGEQRFGPINGVIHTAGIIRGESFQCAVENLSEAVCEKQFQPKVYGLLVLAKFFKNKQLDFCLLTSSLASILGGLGFTAYSAANIFMDVFTKAFNRLIPHQWISVNWDDWQTKEKDQLTAPETEQRKSFPLTMQEGQEVFQRILNQGVETQVVISTTALQPRLDRWIALDTIRTETEDKSAIGENLVLYARPAVTTPYVPYQNQWEETLVFIWQHFFGIEKIGTLDDFFELGGDSLKAMTVISKIHKETNVIIPMAEFFSRPNIRELAEYIGKAEKKGFCSIEPVEKREYYPLSPAQKRLFIIYRISPDSTAYNITSVSLLQGHLDKTRIEDTFKRLLNRQKNFRTSFYILDEEPAQRIHEEVQFDVEYYRTGDAKQPSPLALIQPFDLSGAPLLRVGLIQVKEQEHILVVDMHHIIADAVSIKISIQDFMALYKGDALPSLKLQYIDFSQWQNTAIESGEIKKQEKYWMNRFKGEIPLSDIPTDYERPPLQSFKGAEFLVVLDEELTKRTNAIAAKNGTTLYTVLLAVCTIFLSKYTGQRDIIIGTPIAGRRHIDLENIAGMFINVLLMRNDADPEKRFEKFLMEVKNNVIEAFDNQDYQFDQLVEQLDLKRDRSRNMLYDVVFAMENVEEVALEIPGLKLKPYGDYHTTSKTDLRFGTSEVDGKINIKLTYSTSLFKRETAEEMVRHYINILKQITEDNRIKLKNIRLSHDLVMFKPSVQRDDGRDFDFN